MVYWLLADWPSEVLRWVVARSVALPLGVLLPVLLRSEVQPSAELLMSCLYWIGGLGWFVIIYVGPVFAVFRAPLSRRHRVMLLCFYVALVLLVFWIQALGYHVWLADAGMRYSMVELFLWQWWQPCLWGL